MKKFKNLFSHNDKILAETKPEILFLVGEANTVTITSFLIHNYLIDKDKYLLRWQFKWHSCKSQLHKVFDLIFPFPNI